MRLLLCFVVIATAIALAGCGSLPSPGSGSPEIDSSTSPDEAGFPPTGDASTDAASPGSDASTSDASPPDDAAGPGADSGQVAADASKCDGAIDCDGVCGGPGVTSKGACCKDGKVDCNGVCDGPGARSDGGACCPSGTFDCAGVCSGPGVLAGDACCADGKIDCNGVCDGPAVSAMSGCCADGKVDCNGVCDGPGIATATGCCTDGKVDCAGACDGAGIVVGGSCCADGKVDCNGVCDGAGVVAQGACCKDGKLDCAGVCDGPGAVNKGACCKDGKVDCAGVCDGPGIVDGARCCASGTCPPPSCCDGYQNGSETGVDCGGSCLAGCGTHRGCTTAADCDGIATCTSGFCQAATSPVMFALPFAQVGGLGRNPVDGTVYASIGPTDATYPDSVVAFAPGSPKVAWAIPIGDFPGPLAVSDDGSTLYAGTTFGIAQIDLATRTVTRTFTVGSDPQAGPAYAAQIRVVPGDATTIAVATADTDNTGLPGVHLYRNGVPLYPGTKFADWQTNPKFSLLNVTTLAFKDAQTLFTYNGLSSGYDLGSIAITATGLSVTAAPSVVVIGYNLDIGFAGGKLFASSGQVLSSDMHVLGTFGAEDTMGRMAVTPDASRVYFFQNYITSALHAFTLGCFDPATFTQSGGFLVDPSVANPDSAGEARQIVQWGTSGLALSTSQPQAVNDVILLPDILDRVHGCAPRPTPPTQYGCITAPDSTAPDGGVRSYVLAASHIATDPATGTLYATVGDSDTRYPNRLVAFPPNSAGVAWSQYVGSSPGPLEISGSGDVAWVAMGGAPLISPVDLTTHTVGAPATFPRDPVNGDVYGTEVHAVPGSNSSVGAAGGFIWTNAQPGLFLFDNGALRYPFTRTLGYNVSSFAFASPNVVYADGDDAFEVLSAGPSALSVTSSVTNLIPGIGYIPLLYGGGRVVDYYGLVIDPVNEVALGTMAVTAGAPRVTRTFTLSPDGSRSYSVYASQGNTYLIKCFDPATRALTGSVTFTTLESGIFPNELALYGANGLAMTVDDTLAILPDALRTPGCEPHR